jgi:hypothetical protein
MTLDLQVDEFTFARLPEVPPVVPERVRSNGAVVALMSCIAAAFVVLLALPTVAVLFGSETIVAGDAVEIVADASSPDQIRVVARLSTIGALYAVATSWPGRALLIVIPMLCVVACEVHRWGSRWSNILWGASAAIISLTGPLVVL